MSDKYIIDEGKAREMQAEFLMRCYLFGVTTRGTASQLVRYSFRGIKK
jgi:hypothetical protein